MVLLCRYGDWQYHYVGRPAFREWGGGWGGYGPNYWGNSYNRGAHLGSQGFKMRTLELKA